MTIYNKLYTKLIGFNELKIVQGNTIVSVMYKYMLYKMLTQCINIIKYIRSFVDIDASKLHVVKLYDNGKSAIILDDKAITFNHLIKQLNMAELDNTMSDIIMLKFDLVNNVNDKLDKICFKNLLIKYKDTKSDYDNTIGNILLFNNIYYNNDSYFDIKIMRDKKMVIKKNNILKLQ